MDYSRATIQQLFNELKTSLDGLNPNDVQPRLTKYGANKLPQKKPASSLYILLRQLRSPLSYVLFIAAIISIFTRDLSDAYVIIGVVLINAGVGYWQESKAERTFYKLKQILPPKSFVKRGGDIKEVLAEDVVPGDLMLLKAGEKVVADARVIKSVDLTVDEAFLTGESRPVSKSAVSSQKRGLAESVLVYAGSVVQYGQGEAIVIATGNDTKLGSIAQMVQETEDVETPLQRRIKKLANRLVVVLLFIALVIFLIGILREYVLFEMFKIAVAVAVAAIPEGLLIAITVILAIGMQRILKKKALVRQLLAAETLGSTSVICTDKTGTLTEGSMKVVRLVSQEGLEHAASKQQANFAIKQLLRIAFFCNDAIIENYHGPKEQWRLRGRPTDRSLLQLVLDNGLPIDQLSKKHPRLTYLPFGSAHKFMATVNEHGKHELGYYLKGAPEVVLEHSYKIIKGEKAVRLTEHTKKTLLAKAEQLSGKGYRVLAGAYKIEKKTKKLTKPLPLTAIHQFVFVGLYVIADPLRPEAKETIRLAKNAGIKTVMITGDHKRTAIAIAENLGLPSKKQSVISGDELKEMSDKELLNRVQKISIYARVAPEDKLRIVRAWQEAGFVTAMTGDGINDAPALKKADIGIAIGSGTEVAKETADLVLLDDNFRTIVSAIKEGRVIFANVKKVTLILLSTAFTEIIVIGTSLLFGFELPLLAAQILWVNIVTDGFPDIALTAEPGEENILKYKPVNRKAPILDLNGKVFIGLISAAMAIAVLLGFFYGASFKGSLEYARTLAFTILAASSLLGVYSIRDLSLPLWKRNIFDNKFLFFSVVLGFLLQCAVLYVPMLRKLFGVVPLTITDWLIVLLLSILVIVFVEFYKKIVPRALAYMQK